MNWEPIAEILLRCKAMKRTDLDGLDQYYQLRWWHPCVWIMILFIIVVGVLQVIWDVIKDIKPTLSDKRVYHKRIK